MIDPAQIRAARALLRRNLQQLEDMCGVSKNWISRIEREQVTGSRELLSKIQQALEEAGVEFLPNSGVRKRDWTVETYEGADANERLIEDIYRTLRDTGGEILIAHLDEEKSIKNLGKPFIEEQIRKRKAAGITHRLLVRKNDPGLIPPYDTYHIMPNKYFAENYLLWIYGTKLALLAFDEKSVVIDDYRFAECARKLFNFIWDNTHKVEEQT
jgi:transcriptional regulator with XRE-family HTH domain